MKIVSLVPSATEMVASLGLVHRLVGVTHSCDHPPEVADLPRVTSTSVPVDASGREIDRAVRDSVAAGDPLYRIDLPLVRRLAPDLMVTQGVCDVCAVGEAQATACLAALDEPPVVVSMHPHRFEDVLEDLMRLGRATGVEDRARELVSELRRRIETVRRRVGDQAPVDVVVLEWVDPLFSAGHWTPDLVDLAGGRELLAVPGERSRELAWDEVRAADPQVLVLACCGRDEARTRVDLDRLRDLPGYDELRAVRGGRVHIFDGGAHFSRPGPRLVESVERLAGALHRLE